MSFARPVIRRWIIGLAGLLAIPCATAHANSVNELDFAVSSVSIQAKNSKAQNQFGGLTHTGEFVISTGKISTLDIEKNGISVANLPQADFSIYGDVFLTSGLLDHGTITISAWLSQGQVDSYTFNLEHNSGSLRQTATKSNYVLTGLTDQGNLSSGSIAGVNVAPWFAQQPLLGSFIQFYFKPNAKGYDGSTNLKVATFATVAVPTPEAIWGGLTLMGVFGGWKIYRRQSHRRLPL